MNSPSIDLDWRRVHYAGSTIVDLHAHPGLKISLFDRAFTARFHAGGAFNPFSFRSNFFNLRQGGVAALLSAIYPPERQIVLHEAPLLKTLRYLRPKVWHAVFEGSYFDVANRMLDDLERAVAAARDPATGRPQAQVARSLVELEAILAQGNGRPIAMIHCLEGGHSLNSGPGTTTQRLLANLEHYFRRGAAYLTLAHFFENDLVHPCFPWPENIQKFGYFRSERNVSLGLKPAGEQVVERMVELGMLIDLSHCTPPARQRIYDIVGQRAPLLMTHVGAYAVNPDPYNPQDWELRRIADSGGMVGVIFMPYWLMPHASKRGINSIVRTLRHFVDVAGSEHVGIGSDFDGFTDPPDDLPDARYLGRLTQRLLAERFTPQQISQIWGGNALRVLRQGWGREVVKVAR
jgi:microsomal dipeptidase-like Zn-dependent dipeptidase